MGDQEQQEPHGIIEDIWSFGKMVKGAVEAGAPILKQGAKEAERETAGSPWSAIGAGLTAAGDTYQASQMTDPNARRGKEGEIQLDNLSTVPVLGQIIGIGESLGQGERMANGLVGAEEWIGGMMGASNDTSVGVGDMITGGIGGAAGGAEIAGPVGAAVGAVTGLGAGFAEHAVATSNSDTGL